MHEDHAQLDDELARLAQTLCGGDHMHACLQLAELALKLDHYIVREERTLSLAYQTLVQREHRRLRELVAAIASAVDRGDDRRGVELVDKLRSVLLLHLAKEELLLAPLTSHAIH